MDGAADLLSLSLAADPDNPELLQTCFNLMLSAGRLPEAIGLAKRLEQAGALNGVDRVTLALDRAKAGDFAAADLYLQAINGQGLEHFLNPMLRAWTQLATVGLDGAERALAPLGAINGFQPLYELQLGLISDVAGKPQEAAKHYNKALEVANERAFRLVQLVANFRLRQGHPQGAAALYATFDQEHPGSFLVGAAAPSHEGGGQAQGHRRLAAGGHGRVALSAGGAPAEQSVERCGPYPGAPGARGAPRRSDLSVAVGRDAGQPVRDGRGARGVPPGPARRHLRLGSANQGRRRTAQARP